MESLNLHNANNFTQKKYMHFSINSDITKNISNTDKTAFFYIGENAVIIQTLINKFNCGYTTENVEKAVSILTKIAEKQSSIPDLILVDGLINISSLKSFHQFIAEHPYLASIPFLIEGTSLNKKELVEIRKLSFVDDIIILDEVGDKLISKIKLIARIKNVKNSKFLQKNITASSGRPKVKNYLIKRLSDIILSSIIIVLLGPLFLIIAIAIKLESKGPVFYISKRAGRGYKIFDFIKFRTMLVGSDKIVEALPKIQIKNKPVFFKIKNDPCITKVGRVLRSTSLDELPQLVNVLLGDMSLVGNRPLPLYEAQTLTTDVWAERFLAPAGITGLWQIKKKQKDMSVEERIGLDIVYANRNNFIYDLWIVANTPTALIQNTEDQIKL